ncbi:MAG: hypothetical protein C4522_22280 [Desulfobacteraceae bacterium]|nr:MAG: hypothetical protein C4522_22280 [Desulfobacteraceae bacterium]
MYHYSEKRILIEFTQMIKYAFFDQKRQSGTIVIVFILMIVFLFYKSFYLFYPDLAFTYPFKSFDSYQWISDALLYAGYNIDISYRNPGLPILIALLMKIGFPNLLPVLSQLLLVVFFIYLTCFLRRYFEDGIVAVTILFFFFNFSIQTFFDYVLADQWAVTLQLIAIYYLSGVKENRLYLIPFVIFASLSFLFQFAVGFLLPAFVIYFIFECRHVIRNEKRFYALSFVTVCLALAIIAPNLIYKWIRFGTPFYSQVNPFQLVQFHLFGIPYYGINYVSFFGLPVAVFSIYGMFTSLAKRDIWILIHIGVLSSFLFWILFYTWLDVRFLLYFLPFLPFYFANGLKKSGLIVFVKGYESGKKNAAIAAILVFCTLYGLHDKKNPFERSRLPILPFLIVTFPTEPVSKWEGNLTILPQKASIVLDGDMLSFFRYYRKHRKEFKKNDSDRERMMLQSIHNEAIKRFGTDYIIEECGYEKADYYSQMKRKILFQRDPVPCGKGGDVRLIIGAGEVADYEFSPLEDNSQQAVVISGNQEIRFDLQPQYLEKEIRFTYKPIIFSGDQSKITIRFSFHDGNQKLLGVITYVLNGRQDFWNPMNTIDSGIPHITNVHDSYPAGEKSQVVLNSILEDYNKGAKAIHAPLYRKEEISGIRMTIHSWYPDRGKIQACFYGLNSLYKP